MRIPAIPTSLMIGILALVVLLVMVLVPRHVQAQVLDQRTICATPCKVITLNAEEERALLGQNMVFDTAAQGRQIDLFGVTAYFRQKIANAPAGDVKSAGEAQPGVTVSGNAPPAVDGPKTSVDK